MQQISYVLKAGIADVTPVSHIEKHQGQCSC